MQVDSILEAGLQSAPVVIHKGVYNPARPMPLREAVREPTIRAYLLARLPHSLLFGRLRGGSEQTLQRPSPLSLWRDATTPEQAEEEEEEDGELEALVRALDLPIQSSGAAGVCSPNHHRVLGFHPPASLAERWMR
jgi:hypothetical protein